MTAAPTAGSIQSNVLPVGATIGALGVVYGDIGTSPLYALKEAARAAANGGAISSASILGVVSLILWALILIVSIKYALLILRADIGVRAALSRCWRSCMRVTPRRARGGRSCWLSASWALRCSMATAR